MRDSPASRAGGGAGLKRLKIEHETGFLSNFKNFYDNVFK